MTVSFALLQVIMLTVLSTPPVYTFMCASYIKPASIYHISTSHANNKLNLIIIHSSTGRRRSGSCSGCGGVRAQTAV